MNDLFGATDEFIPGICLWQPWASLVFVTEPAWRKGHETRGYEYPTKYHGKRIGILACLGSAPKELVTDALNELATAAFGADWRKTLPRGSILGTVRLGGCGPSCQFEGHIGHADRIAGIWGKDRFGWRLDDPEPLASPLPWKGKQGWLRIPAQALAESSPA